MIDILIPTLGRPDKLAAVKRNVDDATQAIHRVIFIVEESDRDSYAAAEACGATVIVNQRTPNYAGAINTAYELTDSEWLFCGADDLNFHHGWDWEILRREDDWFQVYGTNDLLNPYVLAGAHATHHLTRRDYLDDFGGVVDQGPGSFLPEMYDHNFTDTEYIGTAKMRSRFKPVLASIVEHLHPDVGKAPRDATYERSMREYRADDDLYEMRRDLWFRISR